jgi:hypothetical protein
LHSENPESQRDLGERLEQGTLAPGDTVTIQQHVTNGNEQIYNEFEVTNNAVDQNTNLYIDYSALTHSAELEDFDRLAAIQVDD